MYQALYRKWRPQTFDQVVGQGHITETLKNQVINDRLSHAYIFIGTRGTGKTTCARILAKAVNCENLQNGNPCGVCPACRGINDGSVLDVVELDAASNNGVDNVRALREEAVFSPANVRKRVYIIDEVHMLSTAAFNALLKILEEPPAHLMFILATTELHKVPATILSRCQRHSFRRIDTAQIAEYLEYIAKQERLRLSHEAAELIARLAEGGVRDALSLLDQCSGAEQIDLEAVYSAMGLAGNRRTAKVLDFILKQDSAGALREFSDMWMDGKDPATFLGELSNLMRDVLMMHVAPNGGLDLISGGFDTGILNNFAKRMTSEELICAMDTVQRAMGGMRDAKNPKTAAELCLVSLCSSTRGESVAELRARISRLEARLESGDFVSRRAEPAFAEEPEEEEWPERNCMQEEYEQIEDDIDPAMFTEEQPEDAFLQRSDKVSAQPAPAVSCGDIWKETLARVMPTLPRGVQVFAGDPACVRGKCEGNVLRIEVKPGFYYGSFNKQEILNKFADAARSVSGQEMRVQLAELCPEQRQQRSIDELKNFPEVRFI